MKKTVFRSVLLKLIIGSMMITGQTSFAQRKSAKIEKTKEVTPAMLTRILEKNRGFYTEGKVADYIPELSKMNEKAVSFAVVKENGEVYSVGDVSQKFTIQSISKIVSLMVAVQDRGETEVFSKMGYYGTDKPFNHYANLETMGKPLNPLMNAGAILTTSMIIGSKSEGFDKILAMVRYISKNDKIDYSKEVYLSEKETGHKNRGMFYLMKNNGLITGDEELLDNYFRQCSIEITAEDLAKIGYFFANECVRFDGDKTYQNKDLARLVQSQMLTAGMYEFSGEYARTVGLPSKSGVGGGITVSVPGRIGIGAFSPGLDKQGNSVVAYKMIYDLVQELDLSIF